MKKFKLTFIVTSADDWYNKKGLEMKQGIESGKLKEELHTNKDKEEGLIDLEITFEELSL